MQLFYFTKFLRSHYLHYITVIEEHNEELLLRTVYTEQAALPGPREEGHVIVRGEVLSEHDDQRPASSQFAALNINPELPTAQN